MYLTKNAHVALWCIPGVLVILAEFINPVFFLPAFLTGIVIEIWAAVDSVRGNTLSEIIWNFKQPGDWSKAFFVTSIAFYISYNFWLLSLGNPASTALAIGLCVWLVVHFTWRGRFG